MPLRSIILLLAASAVAVSAKDLFVSITGNDHDSGSVDKPFRTIQKGANTSEPGDIIHVSPGFFEETVTVNRSGKVAAPIQFKGSPGTRSKGFVVNASDVTIDGFDIGNDPVAKYDAAIHLLPKARNISILNNHIHHLTNVYGIKLDERGTRPEDGPANCIISNNFLEYIGYINVNLNGSNHLVINNAFANSFGEGDAVRAWGADHRIVGNVITNMGLGSRENYRGHPDIMQTFGDWGVCAYNIVFERNYCADSLSQICQLEQKNVRDIRDWTFRNNIFVRMAYAANCDLPGVWWNNNLFYRCTTNIGFVIIFSEANNKKGAAWRSGAYNNIFIECGSDPNAATFGWYLAPDNLTDLDCDYNFVCGPKFSTKKVGSRNPFRFCERHGIVGGDPGIAILATARFELTPGSRLASSGKALQTFSDDYFGRNRALAWSIGPCQVVK